METHNESSQKSNKFSTPEQGAQEVRIEFVFAQTEFVFVRILKLWKNFGKFGLGKLRPRALSVYSQIVILEVIYSVVIQNDHNTKINPCRVEDMAGDT